MKTKEHPSKEMVAKIIEALKDKPSYIGDFLVAYGQYVEMFDDLIDEPFNVETLIKMQALGNQIYTSKYWIDNYYWLFMVDLLNNVTYGDSVAWETAPEAWKRIDAKCLSHCGYNILFGVLIKECGPEVARPIIREFREGAHKNHINDIAETRITCNMLSDTKTTEFKPHVNGSR